MSERPEAVLKIEPHQLPALRAAFLSASNEMNQELGALYREGRIAAPWLGDPVSSTVKDIYDAHVMGAGTDSAFGHLIAYRDELVRVHDNLAQMEAEYRRT